MLSDRAEVDGAEVDRAKTWQDQRNDQSPRPRGAASTARWNQRLRTVESDILWET